MTIQGIHWATFSMQTIITGAVARFKGMVRRRLRGGVVDKGIRGRGTVNDFMTKTMDLRLVKVN